MIQKLIVKIGYPNQIIPFNANGSQASLKFYLKGDYFYANLYLNGELIIAGTPVVTGSDINLYPTALNFKGKVYVTSLQPDKPLLTEDLGTIWDFFYDDGIV